VTITLLSEIKFLIVSESKRRIRQLHFSNFSVNAKPNPSAAYKFSVNATFFFLTGRRTAYNYIKKQKIWYKAVQTKIKLRRKKKEA